MCVHGPVSISSQLSEEFNTCGFHGARNAGRQLAQKKNTTDGKRASLKKNVRTSSCTLNGNTTFINVFVRDRNIHIMTESKLEYGTEITFLQLLQIYLSDY